MSVSNNEAAVEKTNDWHALPGMIGDAINADAPHQQGSGGYAVTKSENGTISIYREIEHAADVDELENEGDAMLEWYDWVSGNELVATIPAPKDGWEDEVHVLPGDIFGGYE